MTDLLYTFSQPLAQTLVATLVLILLVLAIRRPVTKYLGPDVAYWLWALPVARLIFGGLTSPVSLWSLRVPDIFNSGNAAPGQPDLMLITAPSMGEVTALPTQIAPEFVATQSQPHWSVLIFSVWIIGVALTLGNSLYRQSRFSSTLQREALPVSSDLQMRVEQLASQINLKHSPRICASLISACPFVANIRKPVICVPAWFEETQTTHQQEIALAHEMMHIKRKDLFALQACEIVRALFWFIPFKQTVINAFRTDQEAACDADVLRALEIAPHAYGLTLVETVRQAMPSSHRIAHSLTLNHALKERLKVMSHPKPNRSFRRLGMASVALLGAGSLLLSATAGEEKDVEKTTLTINDSDFIVNGEKIENRKFILLGNPFDIPEPPGLDKEIDALTSDIDADVRILELELSALDDLPPPPIPPLPPGANDSTRHEVFIHRMDDADMDDETRAKWKEWERKIEEHAKRIEERHAQIDEQKIRSIEVRIEQRAEELEKRIEASYGEAFEARMTKLGKSVEKLALECRDRNLDNSKPVILAGEEIEGAPLRAICLKAGDQADVSLKALIASGQLTDTEADEVRSQLSGTHRYTIVTE